MATNMKAIVSRWNAADPNQTKVVNTLHFRKTLPELLTTTEWDALALEIRNGFQNVLPIILQTIEVRMYDLGDPEPRPPKAVSVVTLTGSPNVGGPREVALCLSFFSDRNLPRQRGRLYLGPWTKAQMDERPSGTVRDICMNLGTTMQDVGGADIDWGILSRVDNVFRKATMKWCDDEWDTVRSRGLLRTTRTLVATNE